MRDIRDQLRDEFRAEPAGAPLSARQQVLGRFSPRGGTYSDGARLAVINIAGLVVAALLLVVARVLNRTLFSFPFLFSGFFVALALIGGAVVFWHSFARAHERAARLRGRKPRPDVFGAIGAIPFAFIGVFQIGTGLIAMLFALLTFSAGRAGAALTTIGSGVLFLVLAVLLVGVARVASD